MKENKNTTGMLSIPVENKRVMSVLEYYGYSGYKFAKETHGVSESKITHIRNGRNKPSLDLINALLNKFPNVNQTWLLTGEGEMLLDNENPKNVEIRNEIIPVPEDDYMVVEFEDLEIAAGKLGGSDISELPETKKRLVPKEYANGKYLVARVYGHSMDDNTKRSLSDGEEVLIKQYTDFIENLPIRTKLFAIVTNDGSRVVKQITKVDKENKKIICHSFNPTWEDYSVNFDEILQIFTVEKKVKSNIFF